MYFRVLFLLLLGFNCFHAWAQDSIYFNSDWNVCKKEDAAYFRTSKAADGVYQIKDYFISGELQFECQSKCITEPLQREGKAIWYRRTGEVFSIKNFENEKETGESKDFYSNGLPKVIQHFKDGKLDGPYTFYYPSGNVFSKGNYTNGLENGIQINYNQIQEITSEIEFRNGVQAGKYKVNNIIFLEKEGVMENGRQNGECTEYHSNGRRKKMMTFKNNLLEGIYTEINFEGEKTCIGYFVNGKPITFENVYEDSETGDSIKFKMAASGSQENWQVFKNNKLVLESFYNDGWKTGIWKTYDINNKVIQEIDYTKLKCKEENFVQKGNENIFQDYKLAKRFYDFYGLTNVDHCNQSGIKRTEIKKGEQMPSDPFLLMPVAREPSLLQFDFDRSYWKDGIYEKTIVDNTKQIRGRLTTIPARMIVPLIEKFSDSKFDHVYFGQSQDGECKVTIFFSSDKKSLIELEKYMQPWETDIYLYLTTLPMPTEELDGKYVSLNYGSAIAEALQDNILDPKKLFTYIVALIDANEYTSQKEIFELFRQVQTEKEKLLY